MINIGILGAGAIAGTMAETIVGMIAGGNKDVCLYAVASRTKEKADAFAKQYGISKAFGSYEEMLADKDLNLVYIATPHSHHYEQIKLCLNYDKHVLCEKAFTVNAKQAREVCDIAKQKKLLLTEAIWTRYQPMRSMIDKKIESGIIGDVTMLTANLSYAMLHKERITKPELAGGALLDIGVYTLNFAAMIFGYPDEVHSVCQKNDLGVDLQSSYTLSYNNGKMAVLCSSAKVQSDRYGIIHGSKGFIQVHNINNPQKMSIYDKSYNLIEEIDCPKQITGYEYEVMETVAAINSGKLECDSMPHSETIRVMELMDTIRGQLGIKYPCE